MKGKPQSKMKITDERRQSKKNEDRLEDGK